MSSDEVEDGNAQTETNVGVTLRKFTIASRRSDGDADDDEGDNVDHKDEREHVCNTAQQQIRKRIYQLQYRRWKMGTPTANILMPHVLLVGNGVVVADSLSWSTPQLPVVVVIVW